MKRLPKDEVTPVTEAIEAYVDGVTASLQLLSAASQRAVSDATRLHNPDTRPQTAFKNAAMVWSTWARKMAKMASDMADGIALLAKDDGPTVLLSIDTLVLPEPADGEYWFETDENNPLKWSEGALPEASEAEPEDRNVVEVAFRALDSGTKIIDADGHRISRNGGAWSTPVQLQMTIPRDSDLDVPVGMVSGPIVLKTHAVGVPPQSFPFYGQLA